MSIERRALSGLKATAVGRAAGQGISWVATLVVFRLVAPEDYGVMAIAATLVGIGTAVAEFGLGASLVQSRELPPDDQARLAGLVWLMHGVMALLVVAGAPLAAWIYEEPRLQAPLQVASLSFVFAAAGAVPAALAARDMDFGRLARIEFTGMLAGSAATLSLAWAGMGIWALVAGMIVPAAVRSTMLVAKGPNPRPRWGWRGMGRHLQFSGQMAATQVIWAVVSQADVLIGGRLLSKEALGQYSVAVHLATLPMHKVMGVVNQVAFAAVARLQDDLERLRARVMSGTRVLMALAVGLLWLLGAVAPELVPLLLGARWRDAVPVLQLVSLVVPLRMLMMMLSTAVSGLGAAGVNLRNTLTAALVWPPALWIGASHGVVGLAAAWLVASPLSFALNLRRTAVALGVAWGELLLLAVRPLFAGALLWLTVLGARLSLEGIAPWASLLVQGALGLAIYAAALSRVDPLLWTDLRQLRRAPQP